eukprot:CAMPEP_0198211208 /NCGR_PEP_ID=MMETSP1445-20131203/22688_1 /TAXON_ID=36898 /ORGANISM="Pyramimonas sp., Strain CCMP2087" /LENGTH=334 /DNA_ID=CAMNT_0043885421 /DNA_START=140 /DNA_END=1141 /DNA_ORIENTATION=-
MEGGGDAGWTIENQVVSSARAGCGHVGYGMLVYRELNSDGVVDSLMEIYKHPLEGMHGARRMVKRLSLSEDQAVERQWFKNNVEALTYIEQNQEENRLRGLPSVVTEIYGGEQAVTVKFVSTETHHTKFNELQTQDSTDAAKQSIPQLYRQSLQQARNDLQQTPNEPNCSGYSATDNWSLQDTPSTSARPVVSESSGVDQCDDNQEAFQESFTRGNTDMQNIAQYFHLPINTAAKELGICLTMLKKMCRQHGLKRWPHRKLKSIDKILGSLNNSLLTERSSEEQQRLPLFNKEQTRHHRGFTQHMDDDCKTQLTPTFVPPMFLGSVDMPQMEVW